MSDQKNVRFTSVLINLLIVVVLSLLIIVGFFFVVLPSITDHGESVTVPDLKGMHIDELGSFLEGRNLAYRVNEDSSYSPDYKPLAVLKQFPPAFSKVKEKRKIYITLNSSTPPNVSMPNLVTTSVKSAQMRLKSLDLEVGKIKYVPDFADNTVLKQLYKGKTIKSGTLIPKGSKIDFEVANGFGKRTFAIDDFKGRLFEEVKYAIVAQGLKLGKVRYEESDDQHGVVLKQIPEPGTSLKIGSKINFWVAQKDSTSINTPDN